MKKVLVLGLLVCCAAPVAPVHAETVYCWNCSENVTQALDRVTNLEQLQALFKQYDEAIQQTAAQLEMVQQNIEQYANMVQNTVRLPRELIGKIAAKLSEAGRITAALNSMRADIQGLANIHDELYRTRDEFKALVRQPKDLLTSQYRTRWDTWSARVDEATKATFQVSGHQLKQLEESGELESYVNSLLDTPEGQQQALMAGNQLAALQIQEARQLRELVATKVQSDLAGQVKKEKEAQVSEEMARSLTDFSKLNFKPIDDPGF